MHKVDRIRILIGSGALVLGALIYVFDRPPGSIVFVTELISAYSATRSLFGGMGEYSPTLLHVVAFSLVTVGVLQDRGKPLIPLVWCAINIAFEFGQWIGSEFYSPASLAHLGSSSGKSIFLTYFVAGVFDWLDIFAAFLGAIVSFSLIWLTDYIGGVTWKRDSCTAGSF